MGEIKDKLRKHKWYKSNLNVRNSRSRDVLEKLSRIKTSIVPGQLIMFDYFEPIHKEELEYYDAMPVTLFFGVFKTEQGKRVLGFNIHYYPRRIRESLMDKIYEMYKKFYKDDKVLKKSTGVEYKALLGALKGAKLDFGVRMYDPNLMRHITPIPASNWPEAILTEGAFKKKTREAIVRYWQNFK